jgi:hypothetical protein
MLFIHTLGEVSLTSKLVRRLSILWQLNKRSPFVASAANAHKTRPARSGYNPSPVTPLAS